MLQTEALEILKTGVNVFLTGVPGAGKTYVVNKYVEWLKDKGIYPSITASTGIAATHIGGRTIHSFIGLGVVHYLDEEVIDQIMQREKLYRKILDTKVLIIDEISMLDAKVLDKVNTILKGVRNNPKPFGGIQVILVGDFFQLPPVQKRGEEQKYFAFMGNAWKESRPLTCYLEEQYRQADETFTKLLLAIRENNIEEMHIEILEELKMKAHKKMGWKSDSGKQEENYEEVEINYEGVDREECRISEDSNDILELHSHNKNVDEINNTKLNLLNGKEYLFKMETFGRASLVEGLIKSCLSPETLKLKKGAKVIFTKNDIEGKYVNGTMGVVVDLDKEGIVIETKNGKLVECKKEEWAIEEDGKVKARIMQYPLRLAWAITVHKSQGMSLDEAVINLGDTFEYGQGYVALSRVRSLEGLYLKSYNAKSLRVSEHISEFDEKIRKDSGFIQEKFQAADKKKLEQTQIKFIENCGGKPEGGVEKVEAEKKETKIITLDYISQGKSLKEISKERDIGINTLYKHLEDLFAEEKINKLELSRIIKKDLDIDIFNIPTEVEKVFKKNKLKKDEADKIKLAPVFKDLKEKYPYEVLRFYRLFLGI